MKILPFACGVMLAAAAPAFAQTGSAPPDLSAMSCADYLKAEQGAQWSNDTTGQPSIDNKAAFDPVKVHDFCSRNPGMAASQALQQAVKP